MRHPDHAGSVSITHDSVPVMRYLRAVGAVSLSIGFTALIGGG